jgi:hypothetical protein
MQWCLLCREAFKPTHVFHCAAGQKKYGNVDLNTSSLKMYWNVVKYFGGQDLWRQLLQTLRKVADKHQATVANVCPTTSRTLLEGHDSHCVPTEHAPCVSGERFHGSLEAVFGFCIPRYLGHCECCRFGSLSVGLQLDIRTSARASCLLMMDCICSLLRLDMFVLAQKRVD